MPCLRAGISSEGEPGREPWKMYFSDLGIVSKTSGAMRKFSERTDLGVWAGGNVC